MSSRSGPGVSHWIVVGPTGACETNRIQSWRTGWCLPKRFSSPPPIRGHMTGIPGARLVEAHGSYATSHCLACGVEYSMEWTKGYVMNGTVPRCDCGGVVKPDITFFGV